MKATASKHLVLDRLSVILLFFLPFVVLPFGQLPFEIPKVFIFEIVIVGLTIWSVGQREFLAGLLDKRPIAIKVALGGLAVLGLIQMAVFPPAQVLFGNIYRLQGAFLLWCLLAWSLVSTDAELVLSRGRVTLGGLGGLFIAALLVGYSQDGRAVGTLGEPNTLAAMGLFAWPFVWFAKSYQRQPLIKLTALAVPVLLLAMTGSRSALVGLGSQLVFWGLVKSKVTLGKSFGVGLLVITLSFLVPFKLPKNELENRPLIWQTAITAGLSSPVIGNGLGRIQEALSKASWELTNSLRFQVVDSSHNIFLDWWVQGGAVGLGLFVWLFIMATKGLVRQHMTRNLAVLLGLLSVLSFNPASVVTLVAFWWILGRGFILRQA